MKLTETLSKRFEENLGQLNGLANSDLAGRKKTAFEQLSAQGIPTTKHEEWKYTNLKPFIGDSLLLGSDFSEDSAQVTDLPFEAIQIRMVNGKVTSINDPEIEGLTISSIKEAIHNHPDALKEHLATVSDPSDSLRALNTAFAEDGLFISVNRGVNIELPIVVRHTLSGKQNEEVCQNRNLILLGANASFKLIQLWELKEGSPSPLLNENSEIKLGDGAYLEHYQIMDNNAALRRVGSTDVDVSKDANYRGYTVCTAGELLRNDFHVRLSGQGAESHLNGVSYASNEELFDHHIMIEHNEPNCYSNQLFKNILGGKSTGVFNGKVYVKEQAQKTNAYQSNKNILLTREATINSKPQLEIYADDVKCSHGATSGQLDEDALFYFMARGIDKDSARAMITYAFAAEVIEKFRHEPLREWIADHLSNKMGLSYDIK